MERPVTFKNNSGDALSTSIPSNESHAAMGAGEVSRNASYSPKSDPPHTCATKDWDKFT
jgi:hypothetical protein